VTLRQRLTLAGLRAAAWLVVRLPDSLSHRLFDLGGAAVYLARPARRRQVRANLGRVCGWLVAEGRAVPRVAAAARDERAMDRLVRAAFRHHARYYLEVLRIPAMDLAYIERHLVVHDWSVPRTGLDGLAAGRGLVYLGLHYGSMELPAAYAHIVSGRSGLTPMETIADPVLQGWLAAQRARVGVVLIDPADTARRLVAHARRGGLLNLVCDRPIVGASRLTELFGAPAALPVGPALVAIATGVLCQVAVARRTGFGSYELDIRSIEAPPPGPPIKARVAGFLAAEARAIEAIVATAPEQWWTLMYPIWDDLR
jgi:KDO2-lipid IV(A) lauroyltransferase